MNRFSRLLISVMAVLVLLQLTPAAAVAAIAAYDLTGTARVRTSGALEAAGAATALAAPTGLMVTVIRN